MSVTPIKSISKAPFFTEKYEIIFRQPLDWNNPQNGYFNQACDVHHIITELKKIFTNKWIIYGISKGGYTTNLQSMYFPEDAQIYIPYVANCCNSLNDSRLYEYIHTEIGDATFVRKQAQYYRDNILQFQLWCLKNKQDLLPLLKNLNTPDAKYRTFTNDDILFEETIAEFNVNIWQYEDDFSPLEKFLQTNENTKVKNYDRQFRLLKMPLPNHFFLLIPTSSPTTFKHRWN